MEPSYEDCRAGRCDCPGHQPYEKPERRDDETDAQFAMRSSIYATGLTPVEFAEMGMV